MSIDVYEQMSTDVSRHNQYHTGHTWSYTQRTVDQLVEALGLLSGTPGQYYGS